MLRRGYGLTDSSKLISLALTTRHARTGLRAYSSESNPTHNVAILGGGITGLASAYYLTQELPRAKITIYEASDRIGGWLSSKRVTVKDGTVLFEAGPRTLRPSSNGVLAARLLQELDLAKDAIFPQRTSPAARNRYVYYPDHLVRMPHPSFGIADNLWSVLTEPIFSGTLLGAFGEIFKNPRDASVQDESVGEFFTRRLSRNTVDRILSAVLHGIYAGDAWQLSAKSLFPSPWRDEVTEGSVFAGMIKSRAEGVEVTKREAAYLQEMKNYNWDPLLKATLKDTTVFTLKDGLQGLVDGLARHLWKSGNVEFRTSTPILSVTPAENRQGVQVRAVSSDRAETYTHAVSALSPSHLNAVAKPSDGEASTASPSQQGMTLVPTMPSVTVMTVNLYYRTPDLHPPGFGYVIPQAVPFEKNPERALGVVFDTAYSPSPKDLDLSNWEVTDVEQLKRAREQGQLINVNDFAWYNMPDRPNSQDDVKERGTKLTVMLGGHWWNDWPAFPDEKEGLTLAKSVVSRHLGIDEEPEVWQVNLQKDCIPQYTVGHEQRLKTAHNNIWREYKGRLRVAGSWMSGVGVNDCLRSTFDVVRSLRDGKDGTGLEHIGTRSPAKCEQHEHLIFRKLGHMANSRTTAVLAVDVQKIGRVTFVPCPGDLIDDFEISLDDSSDDTRNLRGAAEQLRHSDVPVAFPTETVYGLGADATRSNAVQGIYKAKQRPSDNPLIVHFASLKQLRAVLGHQQQRSNGSMTAETRKKAHRPDTVTDDPIPSIYHPLIKQFWPGPLTIILPNPEGSPLATEVTAGLTTFGARMPGNVLALALIKLAGIPVAAPSANASGKPSPTAAEHVAYDLAGRIETIIDGGPCSVGVESTVVNGLSDPPEILRPGGVSAEQLRACSGWENVQIGYENHSEIASQPKAPGMKYRHYAPKAPVILFEAGREPPNAQELQQHLGAEARLGIARTRRWIMNADSSTTPLGQKTEEEVQAEMSVVIRDQREAIGFRGLLDQLNALQEPLKEIIPRRLQFDDNKISLLDVYLGPDTASIARAVFAALRDLDRAGVDAILVEGIDDTEGQMAAAIMNRLRKAAEIKMTS